jgi:hypothetical protein
LHPRSGGANDFFKKRELLFEVFLAGCREAIRTAAIVGRERLDKSSLFEPGDRAVKRSWSETKTGKGEDILDHGVTVFVTVGEAGEDKKRRV